MIFAMVRAGVISDEFWAVVEPLLPTNGGRRGRPWNDHRDMLEAICWRYRTGSPWRDLPQELGRWQTAVTSSADTARAAGRTDRRGQLIAAARHLLETEGAEAITIRRLGAAIGIRGPSVY